ncbi:MAG TPA: trypsin-like peptidase domain-containing protein [Candidatus Dormibacteraeota bacterium]|nr:trypsin-like peptidase domain-containing protein [Candidatus Dormibacteraeota bacterium]
MTQSRYASALFALVGAVIGSLAMLFYASTHIAQIQAASTAGVASAAPLQDSGSDQSHIVAAVKRAEPSVVALQVVINGVQVNPFNELFGMGPPVQNYRELASGSGFVYDPAKGLILTNSHVVHGASAITVVFSNNRREKATIYADNPQMDLALVKVQNTKNLPPALPLGDSSTLERGQWAIAIGEPLELQQSVTVGVVSGFNRQETVQGENGGPPRTFKGLLQTSAPINPGNSGGPLLDMDGDVIGVNQIVASPQAGAQGIGFAIPVNVVKTVAAEMVKNPHAVEATTSAGFIGIYMSNLTDSVRSQLNYHGRNGVVVQAVLNGSPADQAGLEPGDVIQEVNGKAVTTVADLQKTIQGTEPGKSVSMVIWRYGQKVLANVKVGKAPAGLNPNP